jgi:hypothetical protein
MMIIIIRRMDDNVWKIRSLEIKIRNENLKRESAINAVAWFH